MKYLAFAVLSFALAVSCTATEPEPEEAAATGADALEPVPSGTRESPYVGHGVIQEVGTSELVIQHDTIPGFMAAMTMAFPLAEEAMGGDFEVGDEVMFDIELLPEGYRVFRIEEVEDGSDGQ